MASRLEPYIWYWYKYFQFILSISKLSSAVSNWILRVAFVHSWSRYLQKFTRFDFKKYHSMFKTILNILQKRPSPIAQAHWILTQSLLLVIIAKISTISTGQALLRHSTFPNSSLIPIVLLFHVKSVSNAIIHYVVWGEHVISSPFVIIICC